MAFAEDDLLPISALQHLMFCERQWGLIHLEGVWEENRLTAEGTVMHERVHEADSESRGDVRIARGLRLRSLRLGLTGQADVVEFHRVEAEEPTGDDPVRPVNSGFDAHSPAQGRSFARGGLRMTGWQSSIALDGVAGLWRAFPVEYKRGKPKSDGCDEVQLCAQALCLEEMLNVAVPAGAFFYGKPRRRLEVAFDADLRGRTEGLAARLHALQEAGVTPRAEYAKKCDSCSLIHVCLPKTVGAGRSARAYLARVCRAASTDEEGGG